MVAPYLAAAESAYGAIWLVRADVIVEITGKLRHDRWQHKETKAWTGKVCVAIEPGQGSVRYKGVASDVAADEAA